MWNLQNSIVSPHYKVDLAMVLQYTRFQATITRNYQEFNFKISLIRTPIWLQCYYSNCLIFLNVATRLATRYLTSHYTKDITSQNLCLFQHLKKHLNHISLYYTSNPHTTHLSYKNILNLLKHPKLFTLVEY
jgi:hypothetical protein